MDYSLLVGVKRERFGVLDDNEEPKFSESIDIRPTTYASPPNDADIFKRDSVGGMHAWVVEGKILFSANLT